MISPTQAGDGASGGPVCRYGGLWTDGPRPEGRDAQARWCLPSAGVRLANRRWSAHGQIDPVQNPLNHRGSGRADRRRWREIRKEETGEGP